MQVVCFDEHRFGVVRGDGIVTIDAVLGAVAGRPPQERLIYLIEHFTTLRPEIERLAAAGPVIAASGVTFRPAIPGPAKLCCAARNYREHGARA